MGYYTNFQITLSTEEPKVKSRLEEISGEIFDGNDSFFTSTTKGYDYAQDVSKVSKEFPNILITIDGDGEDNYDIGREYGKNGKYYCQHANIVFEEFNPKKLKKFE